MLLPRRILLLFLIFALLTLATVSAHEEGADEIEEDESSFDGPLDEGDEGGFPTEGHDAGSGGDGGADDEAAAAGKTPLPTVKVETVPYVKPPTELLEFAETFDGDIFSRWIKSAAEKFTGAWSHAERQLEAITGDKGLRLMDEAKHHGISTKMSKPMKGNKGKQIVVSYEAKFEESLSCGGAYLKLFQSSVLPSHGSDMSEFNNETPYIVMFGPDRCGSTNKVHLIIKQLNPLSKEWVEHHLADPPRVPQDSNTHLYSFVLKPDNTYEVMVDDKVEKSGSMASDFTPPFTPATEVDDPDDKKPEDWVDESRITDPNAKKPDDWDEDAPREITDPKATMPDGWLVDEPKTVPDPNASKPEDWNDEDDGEWTAPAVPNPACTGVPGCGEWKAPMIRNPDYKGSWFPPMIDNPDYKGEWKPRQIPNKDYFISEDPHALPDFDAIGFELWTIQKGILFDNILVARNIDAVKAFTDLSWKVRHGIETAQEAAKTPKKPTEDVVADIKKQVTTNLMMFAGEHPVMFGFGAAGGVLVLVIFIIKLFKRPQPVPEEGEEKKVKTGKKEKSPTKSQETSSGDSNEEESEEKEEKEKEPEVLKGKKGQEQQQARQRRAKKD